MKTRLLASAVLGILLVLPFHVHGASAFEAMKTASKQVNDTAKKSLIQIIGKPGSPQVLPVEWEILFYDPYAEQDGTLVTVVGSTVASIKEGYTQMDQMRLFAYKQEEIIAPAQLLKDSTDVLAILKNAPDLKGIKIAGLPMYLKKDGKGPLAPAIWHVEIMAEGAKDQGTVSVGKAKVNATTGKIEELKVRLKKSDK